MAMADLEWMDRANCRDMPPDEADRLFFSEDLKDGRSPHQPHPLAAERAMICGPCPVRRECLAYAKRTETVPGIYGGYRWETRRRKAS
jgi:WhiB family transcriptional regulator, redox-sensing transcriptional regulator